MELFRSAPLQRGGLGSCLRMYVCIYVYMYPANIHTYTHIQYVYQVHEEWNYSEARHYNGADSALVFVCVLLAVYHSGQISPAARAVSEGSASAGRVCALLRSVPLIDLCEDRNAGTCVGDMHVCIPIHTYCVCVYIYI